MSARSTRSSLSVALGVSLVAAGWLSLSAQQAPPADDAFHEAIRNDNLAALKTLVADRSANARGTSGLSPLTMAVGFGSPAAVTMLVDAGANVNPEGGGLTPLHLAWRDAAMTRLLLAHGANLEAKSGRGRTPLLIAASSANTTTDVITQLLGKGANVNAADNGGITPLISAAATGNSAVAKLLLEHGAEPNITAKDGPISTALQGAATSGDVELTRLLLARKVDLTAVSPDGSGRAKNGVIAFGHVTALHLAAAGRSVEVVRLLLEAGAVVDALDMRGMTPLMFAVATDNPEPRIAQLLVSKGASLTIATPQGETAIDWARKYNYPTVLKALGIQSAPVKTEERVSISTGAPVLSVGRPAGGLRTPREAVELNLPLLRTGSARMLKDGGCTACHAQPMVTMTTTIAARRGWQADPAPDAMTQVKQHVSGALQSMLQFTAAGGAPEAELYSALALQVAGAPAGMPTDGLVYYLAGTQSLEGFWHRPASPNRAPIQDGDVSRTALAINALAHWSMPARKVELAARIERGAAWLAAQEPASTEDRVMQLLGQQWAGLTIKQRDVRIKQLLALQQTDGGWSQNPHLATDAYATGEVLYALAELKVAAAAPIQRAIGFLLRTQQNDGTWHVKSRAMPIQPYFESGFPYEHDQWISFSGTAWADMALAMTAPAEGSSATGAPR
ncbi:MAG TPA: ankyrin repeat domain-containing protein [Vicinamibacterales bacterium]|jgi:ankyrin repeat protein